MSTGRHEFIACEQCVEILGRRSTKLVRTWLDLCGTYLALQHAIDVPVRGSYADSWTGQIRFLEYLGYIVTTDTARGILIIPQGHHYDEEWQVKDVFCIDPQGHNTHIDDGDEAMF